MDEMCSSHGEISVPFLSSSRLGSLWASGVMSINH